MSDKNVRQLPPTSTKYNFSTKLNNLILFTCKDCFHFCSPTFSFSCNEITYVQKKNATVGRNDLCFFFGGVMNE